MYIFPTKGMKFSSIFSVYDPSKKAHPHHEIQAFWMQKDTNFGNARILRHFGPEKHQKSAPKRHEFWERHHSLALWAREMPKSAPERHKFREHHHSLALWAREMPKSAPKIHKFWQRHNSSLPWARELPNPTAKDTNFAQNCTHWPQQKCQQNKESIRFSRISHIV